MALYEMEEHTLTELDSLVDWEIVTHMVADHGYMPAGTVPPPSPRRPAKRAGGGGGAADSPFGSMPMVLAAAALGVALGAALSRK